MLLLLLLWPLMWPVMLLMLFLLSLLSLLLLHYCQRSCGVLRAIGDAVAVELGFR